MPLNSTLTRRPHSNNRSPQRENQTLGLTKEYIPVKDSHHARGIWLWPRKWSHFVVLITGYKTYFRAVPSTNCRLLRSRQGSHKEHHCRGHNTYYVGGGIPQRRGKDPFCSWLIKEFTWVYWVTATHLEKLALRHPVNEAIIIFYATVFFNDEENLSLLYFKLFGSIYGRLSLAFYNHWYLIQSID